MIVPREFHHLFWDCQPARLETEIHAPFILERILEYGSLAAVRWAMGVYGAEGLKRFLLRRGRRVLSRKTLAFWILILGLEAEPCFETSSLARSRTFWDY